MADGGGLENRYARERIGGSNPSPSAPKVCFVLHVSAGEMAEWLKAPPC